MATCDPAWPMDTMLGVAAPDPPDMPRRAAAPRPMLASKWCRLSGGPAAWVGGTSGAPAEGGSGGIPGPCARTRDCACTCPAPCCTCCPAGYRSAGWPPPSVLDAGGAMPAVRRLRVNREGDTSGSLADTSRELSWAPPPASGSGASRGTGLLRRAPKVLLTGSRPSPRAPAAPVGVAGAVRETRDPPLPAPPRATRLAGAPRAAPPTEPLPPSPPEPTPPATALKSSAALAPWPCRTRAAVPVWIGGGCCRAGPAPGTAGAA